MRKPLAGVRKPGTGVGFRKKRGMLASPRFAALLLPLLLAGCEPWGKPATPQKEIAENFQTLFRENCSGCHGEDGRGGPGRLLNDGLYLAFIPKASLRKVTSFGRGVLNHKRRASMASFSSTTWRELRPTLVISAALKSPKPWNMIWSVSLFEA